MTAAGTMPQTMQGMQGMQGIPQTMMPATAQQQAQLLSAQNSSAQLTQDRINAANAAAAAAAGYGASDYGMTTQQQHHAYSASQLAAATGAMMAAVPRSDHSPITTSISPLPREYQQTRQANAQMNGIAFLCWFLYTFIIAHFYLVYNMCIMNRCI